MKDGIEEKVRRYREEKQMKSRFEGEIADKKRKLKDLTEEPLISVSTRSGKDQFIDFKHRRYIENTKQLMEAQNKLTEVTHQCEDIKTEINFEERKLAEIRSMQMRRREEQESMVSRKAKKLQEEKEEKIRMYSERVNKNVEHLEQLLGEKEKQNERRMQFVERKKKFEEVKRKLKERHEEELKKSKQRWAEEEKQKKIAWEKAKMEEIQSRTLRNLQPQIQRIVQRSKDERAKIRQKYEAMIEQFRNTADAQFEEKVRAFNQGQAAELARQREMIVEQNNQKLKEQVEQSEQEFEDERIKAKNDYNEEIKALEDNRRRQSEEYMRKNRYFYSESIDEIRQIREEYDERIRELDGSLNRQVEQKQAQLAERNRVFIEQFREQERKKLKARMQEYDQKTKAQMEGNLEGLSEEIAIENSAFERKISRQTDQRIKEEKDLMDNEIKQMRKTIMALEHKISNSRAARNATKVDRDEYETQYLEARSQNEYLNRKLHEVSGEIADLKVEESSVQKRKQQRRDEVQRMWENQIEGIRQNLEAINDEINDLDKIMSSKEQSLVDETNETLAMIQSEANKMLNRRKTEQQRLKLTISELHKRGESLRQILQKQREMMKRFEQEKS